MSRFAKYFETEKGATRAESHYKSEWASRGRFYLGSHGYFPVGDKVTTSEVYAGITEGTVIGAYYATKNRPSEITYVVRVDLPAGHPEAYDENGEEQRVKEFLCRDAELSKHNPAD